MEVIISIYTYKNDLPDSLILKGNIAIDSETMGLNQNRDRLCVLQLSNGNGKAHLVQFEQGNYAAPNLKKLLSDESTIKIFHFARFDIAVIKKYLDVTIKNLYCTKIVSKLVRTYTDSHGLKDLCRELLGVQISKQQQSSYWGAGELTKEQIEYAASDVLYLHQLMDKLNLMLEKEGRMHLAKECFKFLPTQAELDLLGWKDVDIFAH
jgi:ribonuclease D